LPVPPRQPPDPPASSRQISAGVACRPAVSRAPDLPPSGAEKPRWKPGEKFVCSGPISGAGGDEGGRGGRRAVCAALDSVGGILQPVREMSCCRVMCQPCMWACTYPCNGGICCPKQVGRWALSYPLEPTAVNLSACREMCAHEEAASRIVPESSGLVKMGRAPCQATEPAGLSLLRLRG